MRCLAVLAGSIVIACALAVPAVADKARADKLFEDGRKYLTAKEYALACTAFEQSHEADPAIGTQLNIALCYEAWGKTASAYRAYIEAERLAKLKFDNRSKGARKKVDELAPKVPHLVLDLPAEADPSTVLLFDKKELTREALADDVLVDPGPHELEIRVPGAPPKKTTIDIANGERKRFTIELPEVTDERRLVTTTAPRRKGRLYGGIALAVGGAAAMGIAGFVALAARQDYADAIANCDGSMCANRADYEATQSARSRANAMTFVGVGGIALAGAGVYLMLTSGGKKQEAAPAQAAWRLTPVVGVDHVGVTFGGAL